ncbi:MAG: protein translocase subunit SecD, partial [Rhodobacterales bacterium]|nr:protein translocase subunit SecD [Rhodobacterales bacterium]
MKRSPWVVMTYAVLLLLAVATAIPNFLTEAQRAHLPQWATAQTVSLGLDLQGGAHLLLAVDRPALAEARRDDLRALVAEALREAGLPPARITLTDDGLTLPATPGSEETIAAALSAAATGQPTPVTLERTGDSLTLRLTEAGLDRAATDAADRSLEVIRHRVDQVGVSEPVISRVGADRILVQMPGVDNPGQLRDLLGSTAKMSFHMVASATGPGVTALPLRDGTGTLPVEDRVALSGERLDRAALAFDQQTKRPVISFGFDSAGAIRFGELTAENVGQRFAVVLDGQVLTAPVIQQAIPGGQGQITGNFTVEEAQTLAVLLGSGALPASLEVIEERSVGAALGSDSIIMGLITGALGLALVVGIMVTLYGGWGLVASAVLGLNVMLTLAALGLMGATLTLPGIAGIIL